MTTGESEANLRNNQRNALFLLALCQLPSRQTEQRVKVRNISATGLMAEGTLRPVMGEPVWLDLRNIGRVEGVVAWVSDSRFGVAFAKEIDPALVRQPPTAVENEAEPRDYYQRGPLSTLKRQDDTRPDRLRMI